MGFSTHLWFCACKTATLGAELQVPMGCRRHLWICAHKAACLAPELRVSMDHRPNLWICAHKQRAYHQNNKSLLVPDFI